MEVREGLEDGLREGPGVCCKVKEGFDKGGLRGREDWEGWAGGASMFLRFVTIFLFFMVSHCASGSEFSTSINLVHLLVK